MIMQKTHVHSYIRMRTHRYTPMTILWGLSTCEGAPSWTQVQIKIWVTVVCTSTKVYERKVCLGMVISNRKHYASLQSQQPKMHPTGKWACLHLEVWALLYSLRLPQPPGSCSPASGLRLPRPLGSGSPGLRAWQELLAALLLFLVIVQDLVNFNGQG